MRSPVASPALHLSTLFETDPNGRLTTTREPTKQSAPKFVLVRSATALTWGIRADIPDALAEELTAFARAERPVADLNDLPTHYCALGTTECFGPAFEFPEFVPSSSGIVSVEDERSFNVNFHGWVPGEIAAGCGPVMSIVVDGHPVSICFCARQSDVAAEAGVDTAPAYRGRGYAGRVTSAWAFAIRASGRIPLYSTSWTNSASRSRTQAWARRIRKHVEHRVDHAAGRSVRYVRHSRLRQRLLWRAPRRAALLRKDGGSSRRPQPRDASSVAPQCHRDSHQLRASRATRARSCDRIRRGAIADLRVVRRRATWRAKCAPGRSRVELARFRALPTHAIAAALTTVYELHVELARAGWLAVDFYDGCLMYDFVSHDLRVIDLDQYSRGPFTNAMGRMFGSTRFMAPEEFKLGACIDQRTTVFNLGRSASIFLRERGTRSQIAAAARACSAAPPSAVPDRRSFLFGVVGRVTAALARWFIAARKPTALHLRRTLRAMPRRRPSARRGPPIRGPYALSSCSPRL